MIKVVMFDLGQTLIDDVQQRPFPHVIEALRTIAKANSAPKTCLVSDFKMDLKPARAMKEYLAILDAAGLRKFFEPVQKRVTLSNHAAALKPSRKIFKKALERLGLPATPFKHCCFITENAAHIKAAREKLQMQTFQFGVDFTDWADVPELLSVASPPVSSSGSGWQMISVPGHEDLKDIEVQAPASAEAIEEVKSYVASLADNEQIAGRPGKPAFRATHRLVMGPKGKRKLVREGFSLL
jgi:FMN phosphatase YigB (HAD superfamily)